MNVNERQLESARHAVAQPSRVVGGCGVLLYSSRPSSAHVSSAGGFGLGVADVQSAEEVGVELGFLLGRQLIGKSVVVMVVVRCVNVLS